MEILGPIGNYEHWTQERPRTILINLMIALVRLHPQLNHFSTISAVTISCMQRRNTEKYNI